MCTEKSALQYGAEYSGLKNLAFHVHLSDMRRIVTFAHPLSILMLSIRCRFCLNILGVFMVFWADNML